MSVGKRSSSLGHRNTCNAPGAAAHLEQAWARQESPFCGNATQQQLLGGKLPRPRNCSPSGPAAVMGVLPKRGGLAEDEGLNKHVRSPVPSTENPCKTTEEPCTDEQSGEQPVWGTAGELAGWGSGHLLPSPGPPPLPTPPPVLSPTLLGTLAQDPCPLTDLHSSLPLP